MDVQRVPRQLACSPTSHTWALEERQLARGGWVPCGFTPCRGVVLHAGFPCQAGMPGTRQGARHCFVMCE